MDGVLDKRVKMDRKAFIRSLGVLVLAPQVGLPVPSIDKPGIGGREFKMVLQRDWRPPAIVIYTGREGIRLFQEAWERERCKAMWS